MDLRSLDFLKDEDLIGLFGDCDKIKCPHKESIYIKNKRADFFYIIVKGTVHVKMPDKYLRLKAGHFFGEESLIGMADYIYQVHAETDCVLLKIDRERFWNHIKKGDRADIENSLFSALKRKEETAALKSQRPESRLKDKDFWYQTMGWLVCALLPLLVFMLMDGSSAPFKVVIFFAAIVTLSFVTVFRLVPDFISMVLVLCVFLATGIVPAKVVLSGFGSRGFIIIFCFFAVSSILAHSGILHRVMLCLLKYVGKNNIYSNLFLFFIGVLLSLGTPNLFVRSEIAKNFLLDLQRIANVKKHTKTISSLYFSTYMGASLFTQSILTSSMIHFVILNLFWGQYVTAFNWVGWLQAAFVPALILFVGYVLTVMLIFKDKSTININKNILSLHLGFLGKINKMEIFSISTLFITNIAIITTEFHGIPPENILLFIFVFMIVFEFLSMKNFIKDLRWDLLLTFAALSGILSTGASVGMTEWLCNEAKWITESMRHNFEGFTACLIAIIIALRFLFPRDIVMSFSCLVLVPLAQKNGVNPWIIAYIIFTASRMWFFSYQDLDYKWLESSTHRKVGFMADDITKAQFMINLFYILSIVGGIFYWRYMGLLS